MNGVARSSPPRRRRRILVTRLRYTGDVLLTLPLLAALRRMEPEAELHYLAEPQVLAALDAQPEVDVRWPAPRGTANTLRLARRLRAGRFDAAIDLFCNPRSALLVYATGAPVRVGEDRRVRRHAYTLARRLVPGRSAIEQHLDALRGLGHEPPAPTRPVLRLTAPERDAGARLWSDLCGAPGIVLHLGASQPAKEWPVESALGLVRGLAAAGESVLLTTAPNRPEPSRELAARAGGAVRCAPVLDLRAVFGLLSQARAVVSVDGALVHAAVALGRPTVALFGPTDPAIWFPYVGHGPFRVLHADLGRLAPEDVLAALHDVRSLAEVR